MRCPLHDETNGHVLSILLSHISEILTAISRISEPVNQACLYLFESFFHCGSKYGHEIPQVCHFLQILFNF